MSTLQQTLGTMERFVVHAVELLKEIHREQREEKAERVAILAVLDELRQWSEEHGKRHLEDEKRWRREEGARDRATDERRAFCAQQFDYLRECLGIVGPGGGRNTDPAPAGDPGA